MAKFYVYYRVGLIVDAEDEEQAEWIGKGKLDKVAEFVTTDEIVQVEPNNVKKVNA